jgi:hypothetical protein
MNDLSQKKEFADAAQELLGNKAFNQAIIDLRKRWYDQILAAVPGAARDELVAMSKTLDAIPIELQIRINDYKIAADRQRKHG